MTLDGEAVLQAVLEQTGIDWSSSSAEAAAAQINHHLALASRMLPDAADPSLTSTNISSTLADLSEDRWTAA